MKKTVPIKKYLLFTFGVPFAVTVVLTVLFCLLEKNYYYLPFSLDFLIQLSYDALYFFLFAILFFNLGMAAHAIFLCKAKDAVISIVFSAISAAIFPVIAYLIRAIILFESSSDEEMLDYMYSDFLCAAENAIRLAVAVLLIFAVKFFCVHKNIPLTPKNRSPFGKNPTRITFLIYYSLWLTLSVITFLFSGEKNVLSLLYEAFLAVAGYFLSFCGFDFCDKNSKIIDNRHR